MSSTTDWSLVGGDPAPGWPVTIRAHAGRLDKIASFVDDAEQQIMAIIAGADDAGLKGNAADALAEFLTEQKDDLRPIAGSFRTLSGVMSRYARELEDIQIQARRALDQAKLYKKSEQNSQHELDSVRQKLRNQRSQLQGAKWSSNQHRVQAGASNVVDPAGAIQRAQDQQALDREVARLGGVVSASVALESTHKAARDNARNSFKAERAKIGHYRDQYERISRDAAHRVRTSLASSLRNRSNFEKFVDRVVAEIRTIQEFLDNGDWLGALREIVSSLQTVISALTAVVLAAVFVLALVGSAGALAPLLSALLLIGTVLAAAKFVLTAAVLVQARYGDHPTNATAGDLVADGITLILALTGVGKAAGAAKGAAATKLTNDELIAKLITGAARDPSGALNTVGGREVAKYFGKKLVEKNVRGIVKSTSKTTTNFLYTAHDDRYAGNYDTILHKEVKYEFKPNLAGFEKILKYGAGIDPKFTIGSRNNAFSSDFKAAKGPDDIENSWGSVNPVGAGGSGGW